MSPDSGTPPPGDPPAWTAERLAAILGARLQGDGERRITGIAGLAEATPSDLSFLSNVRYRALLAGTHAGAVLVAPGERIPPGTSALEVPDPYAAFARAIPLFHPPAARCPGIRPGAHVDPGAVLGPQASVAPGAFVGPGCILGARVTLHAGVVLVADVRTGDDVVLFPNVTVYPGTHIGNRVIVHAGSVVGSDGFGYVQEEGRHVKIPQVGHVVIEDDVEIGACVTIDRATLGATRIGEGTKIDNLVQIAHNVRIGPRCILVAQVGIAGSTEIGGGTMIAGQSGVAGHLRIGAGVRIGAKSAVLQDVPDGAFVTGVPAIRHSVWLRWARLQERIPEILRKLGTHVPDPESGTGEEP